MLPSRDARFPNAEAAFSVFPAVCAKESGEVVVRTGLNSMPRWQQARKLEKYSALENTNTHRMPANRSVYFTSHFYIHNNAVCV